MPLLFPIQNQSRPGLGREIVCVSTQAASATVGYKFKKTSQYSFYKTMKFKLQQTFYKVVLGK